MKKTLVYYNFVSNNKTLTELHFSLLREYAYIFDEVRFCISIDDTEDKDTIQSIEEKILDIFSVRSIPVIFYVIKNDKTLCEAPFFYNEITKKLNEYELVFYAHGKGMQTGNNEESIRHWITSMYYYCLNFMDEVEEKLVKKSAYYSYGHFLFNKFSHFFNEAHFRNVYCGTFCWINAKKLCDYMEDQSILLPKPSDRYFSENFLSLITPDGFSSHDNKMIEDSDVAMDLYRNNFEVINNLYPNDKDYLNFFKKINK